MNKSSSQPQNKNSQPTMADLMASLDKKRIMLSRGETVSGEVVLITDNDIVVDLGSKAEGVLSRRDFLPEQLEEIKVGSKVDAFVLIPENESGQVILSLFRAPQGGKRAEEAAKKWQKFITALQRQTTLIGRVIEVNKGGLMVEIDKARGFVPSSQVSLKSIESFTGDLVGQELRLKVIEMDPGSNRLVLSAKVELTEEEKKKFSEVKSGDKVKGEITVVAPFGLLVDINGLEGIIFAAETSWEENINLQAQYKPGQEIDAKVTGKDEALGRFNLSLRQMQEDPFEKMAEDFAIDDVVKGTVKEITQNGVIVALEKGVEGLVPGDKVDQSNPLTPGQSANFLVDSIDIKKRKINLAPFITSTVGLIYK